MKRFVVVLLGACLVLAACGGGGGGLVPIPPIITGSYTVTFDANGGTPVSPIKVNAGATIPVMPATVKEDFTFSGWFKDAGFVAQWTGIDTVTKDITLYAKWAEIGGLYYNVDFKTKDGELLRTDRVSANKVLNRPLDPVKEGNLFFGWYRDIGLTNDWSFGIDTVTADITLYGVFINSAYTVTFDGNGGSVTPGSRTVNYGNTVASPTITVNKPSSKLVGWLNGYIPWDFANNTVTANVTLKAWWGSDAYTYPFNVQGGDVAPYLSSLSGPGPHYVPVDGFIQGISGGGSHTITPFLDVIYNNATADVILDLTALGIQDLARIVPDSGTDTTRIVVLILPSTDDQGGGFGITVSLGGYNSLKIFNGVSVEHITASNAFSGCTSLEQVYLPQIKDIAGGAFFNTGTNPLVITMGSAAPSIGGSLFNAARPVTVRIPYGAAGYGTAWQAAFKGSSGITLSFEQY